MSLGPIILGIGLGCGLLLAFVGLRRMFNKNLSEEERKRGWKKRVEPASVFTVQLDGQKVKQSVHPHKAKNVL